MTTEPTFYPETPHQAQADSVIGCAAALMEVVLAFSFVLLSYSGRL